MRFYGPRKKDGRRKRTRLMSSQLERTRLVKKARVYNLSAWSVKDCYIEKIFRFYKNQECLVYFESRERQPTVLVTQ